MRAKVWPELCASAERQRSNVDVPFWDATEQVSRRFTTDVMVVSIKGMPSKRGFYTKKHRAKKFRSMPCAYREEDPDRRILRDWVGPEALELYRPYFGRHTDGLSIAK